MTDKQRLSGVLCPVITPFDSNLDPDADRLIRQCQWLLTQNVGLAVFGTNSEANSLSVAKAFSINQSRIFLMQSKSVSHCNLSLLLYLS